MMATIGFSVDLGFSVVTEQLILAISRSFNKFCFVSIKLRIADIMEITVMQIE
jgi:hypothetical protein